MRLRRKVASRLIKYQKRGDDSTALAYLLKPWSKTSILVDIESPLIDVACLTSQSSTSPADQESGGVIPLASALSSTTSYLAELRLNWQFRRSRFENAQVLNLLNVQVQRLRSDDSGLRSAWERLCRVSNNDHLFEHSCKGRRYLVGLLNCRPL